MRIAGHDVTPQVRDQWVSGDRLEARLSGMTKAFYEELSLREDTPKVMVDFIHKRRRHRWLCWLDRVEAEIPPNDRRHVENVRLDFRRAG